MKDHDPGHRARKRRRRRERIATAILTGFNTLDDIDRKEYVRNALLLADELIKQLDRPDLPSTILPDVPMAKKDRNP